MVSINIKEYKDLYANEINSLLQKDVNYIPKISSTKHSLLLFENQTIIGIGSIWDNSIHPYRDYISIYIDPDKRNNGFGRLLFNEMKDMHRLERFQTAFDSNNIDAINFADSCGFHLGRKCYCYSVNEGLLIPFDYNISNPIVGLCNLSEKQIEDVVVLQYEDYKINHQHINPLSEDISMEEWKMVAFRDLVKMDSYVMLDGSNNVCAYLLSYEIDEETIEIGHTGSRCNNIKDYKAFLYNVVKQLFDSYKEIELEIDDCDMGANILGELFTYKPDISWDAYIGGIFYNVGINQVPKDICPIKIKSILGGI